MNIVLLYMQDWTPVWIKIDRETITQGVVTLTRSTNDLPSGKRSVKTKI